MGEAGGGAERPSPQNRRVAVKAGNGLGKGFCAAVAVLWYMHTHPGRAPSPSSLVNYRYTLVLRPKPSEWPPKRVRSNPTRDPETRRQDRNRLALQRRQKAKDQGLCTKCRREATTQGKTYCDLCLDGLRVNRQQAKDRGLCFKCGGRPAEPGKTRCGPCNEAHRILNRKYNAKRKAQS